MSVAVERAGRRLLPRDTHEELTALFSQLIHAQELTRLALSRLEELEGMGLSRGATEWVARMYGASAEASRAVMACMGDVTTGDGRSV